MNKLSKNKYSKFLIYSDKYNNLPQSFLDKETNGCGTGLFKKICINSLFGILFCISCNIHDLDYVFKKSKFKADNNLRKNIIMVANIWYKYYSLNIKYRWIKKTIVILLAYLYFISVSLFGWLSWYKTKNK